MHYAGSNIMIWIIGDDKVSIMVEVGFIMSREASLQFITFI